MPWTKGQSGNPSGRDRIGTSVAQIARKVLETKKKGENLTRGEKILQKAAELAQEGSKPHMEFLFDRAYGKALESMNLSGGLSLYEQGVQAGGNMTRKELLAAISRIESTKK